MTITTWTLKDCECPFNECQSLPRRYLQRQLLQCQTCQPIIQSLCDSDEGSSGQNYKLTSNIVTVLVKCTFDVTGLLSSAQTLLMTFSFLDVSRLRTSGRLCVGGFLMLWMTNIISGEVFPQSSRLRNLKATEK